MKRFIEEYKGYQIIFEDDVESTVPNPYYEVLPPSNSNLRMILYGQRTLEDIRRRIDKVIYVQEHGGEKIPPMF